MERTDRSESATVWAAEHGASFSSNDNAEDEAGDVHADGANVGHRFRIHGRLANEEVSSERGRAVATDYEGDLDPTTLLDYVARHCEIDTHDIQFAVDGDKVFLNGTVNDDGERRVLEALIRSLPPVQQMESRLRTLTV